MKTKAVLISFLCCVAVCFSIIGCTSKTSVDWNMHATLVMADGTTGDSFALPVSGTIVQTDDTGPYSHYLNLNVELPKSIPYRMSICEPDGDPVFRDIWDSEGDLATQGFCYDEKANAPAMMMWAINTEKQYFIAYWGEEYGNFLVASVDPNVGPAEIMSHFDGLVERMKQSIDVK